MIDAVLWTADTFLIHVNLNIFRVDSCSDFAWKHPLWSPQHLWVFVLQHDVTNDVCILFRCGKLNVMSCCRMHSRWWSTTMYVTHFLYIFVFNKFDWCFVMSRVLWFVFSYWAYLLLASIETYSMDSSIWATWY